MKVSFHPEARKEFFDTINYYDEQQPGLGLEFSREIHFTIQRIIHLPLAWSKLSSNTRRCLTVRFPYGIIYQVIDKEIHIIAIMNLNRKPDYWKKRIK